MNPITEKKRSSITFIINLFPVILILACAAVFVRADEFPISSTAASKKDKPEMQGMAYSNSGYLADLFRDRIKANEDEIRYLINEKDWLQNRIYHLEDLNEPVPWNMQNSMKIKERKIDAAFKENRRLNDLLAMERYKNSYSESGKFSEMNISSPSVHDMDFSSLRNRILQKIRDAGLDEWVRVSGSNNECILENVLPILFSSGSARIADEYKIFLRRLASLIKDHNILIRIDGFADINNIHTSRYPSNFELGAIRAANIVHELVKNGVSPSVFKIATTGKYRQDGKIMSENKSVERRAEILVRFVSPA